MLSNLVLWSIFHLLVALEACLHMTTMATVNITKFTYKHHKNVTYTTLYLNTSPLKHGRSKKLQLQLIGTKGLYNYQYFIIMRKSSSVPSDWTWCLRYSLRQNYNLVSVSISSHVYATGCVLPSWLDPRMKQPLI